MKLLELLVKERIKWPDNVESMSQVDEVHLKCKISKLSMMTALCTALHLGGVTSFDEELLNKASELLRVVPKMELADDWQTVIVTKEQYDNACKLVDDGYTLWFGGECPVNHDTLVDLAFDDNADIDSARPAFHYDWKNQSPPNIIAYKIAITKPDGSDEELSVVYEPSDLLSLHVPDVVNHPSHYTNGKVECIDAIESATVGKTGIEAVCVANVIKYLWRYEDKNGLEDIKKAQWYLNKLIEVKK